MSGYVPKRPWSHCGPDQDEMSAAMMQSARAGFARVLWSGFKFLINGREKSFAANRVKAEAFARERFARLLREPFPGMTDAQIAEQWEPALGVHKRTIENWLRCQCSASITDMTLVGAVHGIWQTAAIFVGEDKRDEVLERIGRK